MSSDSYSSYRESVKDHTLKFAADPGVRKKADDDYKERIKSARETVTEKKERVKRETKGLYDDKLVRLGCTKPKAGIKRIHRIEIDNSGSNRTIAEHIKASSGFFIATLGIIDPESQVCIDYFSDHCDGTNIMQVADFVSPDSEGDKILYSTTQRISPVSGGDEAEAIECALWEACEIDFGDAEEKHLYLVSDVVAHGMGMRDDNGCPNQRDWKKSVEKVYKTYSSFAVVGCGGDPEVGELQKQFIKKERLPFDFIDLSEIGIVRYRLGITLNAVLFLIARQRGLQTVELFLGSLYEKWLSDPLFGANTDLNARNAILRFTKYLEEPKEEIDKMMKRIIV